MHLGDTFMWQWWWAQCQIYWRQPDPLGIVNPQPQGHFHFTAMKCMVGFMIKGGLPAHALDKCARTLWFISTHISLSLILTPAQTLLFFQTFSIAALYKSSLILYTSNAISKMDDVIIIHLLFLSINSETSMYISYWGWFPNKKG